VIGRLWRQHLTLFDRRLVIALGLLVLLSFLLPLRRSQGQRVIISSGEQVLFVAPLAEETVTEIVGPLGTTRVGIDAGGVRVLSSPCPRKICIGMGEARHSGDLLACVPNQVVIRIEGGAEDDAGYDLLSR